ncbi:MAG: O-antigen ligase family protein [Candidatus Moranbacteria bacterium]|nr:O-antigen ligase family protein [Candidatus Moranbacteria bacterium]
MPILLILIGITLSVIANRNYYVGLGILKGWFVFPIIFGIIFYDALKKDDSLLGKTLLALFFSGAAVSAAGAVYKISGFLTYDGRLRIFYDSPNQLAMFLAVPFLIGIIKIEKFGFEKLQALASKKKAELWKVGAIISGLLLILLNLYLTKSYGAWLALAIVLIVIFWLKYRTFRHRIGLLILIFLAAIIIGQTKSQKLEGLANFGGRSSLDSRVMIWKSAGRMIKDNPLFGIGPGNFQNKYLEYQKYFPPYLEWAVPQPHNVFLAFWLEAGFIGLVGFVLLLAQFFKDNKKAIENNRLYGILCLAIIIYFLIHGLIDTTYWRNDMAFLFWTIIPVNCYLAIKNKTLVQN